VEADQIESRERRCAAKVTKREGKALDAGQLAAFLDAARANRIYEFVMLAVTTGRDHRSQQAENRRLFGPDYRDDLNLVFSTPVGDYLKPDTLTAKVCLLATKAGLNGSSLHTLRHSHGSQLLANGVPLPVVSKRLGHSSVYVTATVYSHALTQDELAAADVWDSSVQQSIPLLTGERRSPEANDILKNRYVQKRTNVPAA